MSLLHLDAVFELNKPYFKPEKIPLEASPWFWKNLPLDYFPPIFGKSLLVICS